MRAGGEAEGCWKMGGSEGRCVGVVSMGGVVSASIVLLFCEFGRERRFE